MSKFTMYFKTTAEKEAYFPSGVPSKVLAIVQENAAAPAVMYTSSNNSPVEGGKMETQGGYVTSPEDAEKLNDFDTATDLSEEILYDNDFE